MKRLLMIVSAIAFVFSSTTVTFASDSTPAKTVTLSSDQVIDDDYFAAGDIVEIFGTVNGDVYAAGGQVIIDGTVNGDVLVAGGSVTLSGSVAQDVRVAGGTILIQGSIGQNITFLGGEVSFSDSSQIAGNIVGAGGNTLISTPEVNSIKVASGNLTITNSVLGNVDAAVEQMRLTSGAAVTGNVTYWSEIDMSIDETATVSGTITRKQAINSYHPPQQTDKAFGSGYFIYRLLSTLVFGLLLLKLLPTQIVKISNKLSLRPWTSLGIGFATLILVPIASLVIMITIIGFPIGGVILIIYGLSLMLAKYISMVSFGNWILGKLKYTSKTIYKAFLVGLLIYFVMKLSPITSIFTSASYLLAGLGGITLAIKEYLTKNSE